MQFLAPEDMEGEARDEEVMDHVRSEAQAHMELVHVIRTGLVRTVHMARARMDMDQVHRKPASMVLADISHIE